MGVTPASVNPPPTPTPSADLTVQPTAEPTPKPTAEPTAKPTTAPTPQPTQDPTVSPTPQPTSASATSTMTPSTSTSSTESDLWPLVCGPPCRCTYWRRSGRLCFNSIEQCQEHAEAEGYVYFTYNPASGKCATSNTCFYNTRNARPG